MSHHQVAANVMEFLSLKCINHLHFRTKCTFTHKLLVNCHKDAFCALNAGPRLTVQLKTALHAQNACQAVSQKVF